MIDPFNLERFVVAQAPLYERVISELQTGRKRSHWMWFIFPQVAGLGHSEMAQPIGRGDLYRGEALGSSERKSSNNYRV
jgi:uncharacterized protein (DUF1810 family)